MIRLVLIDIMFNNYENKRNINEWHKYNKFQFNLDLKTFQALLFIMLAAAGSFFSRISDPRFGGTYMTLLNSISNFGFVWASTLGLKCMDYLTIKLCSNDGHNNCSTDNLKNVRH